MVGSATLSEKLLSSFHATLQLLCSFTPPSNGLSRAYCGKRSSTDSFLNLCYASSPPKDLFDNFQANSPSNLDVYNKWVKKFKVEPVIEEVPQTGKKVVWIGSKNAENVVFYVHGGGFMVPISDFMFTFWLYVQRAYAKRTGGKEISIVSMEYSLHPQTFPTQLTEIVHAFNHFLSASNVKPSNIHLAGDSAGANLVLQLLSHTLHPLPSADVPASPLNNLSEPIRGTLLISPWCSLNERTSTHVENTASDCLTADSLLYWGSSYLGGVKYSHIPYIKTLAAGERWFDGVDKLTERILITAGDAECLLEDAIRLHDRLQASCVEGKPKLEVDVEEDGVHEDMMMELGAGGRSLTPAGEGIVEWLLKGHGVNA
ncbi:hypothetical protein AAF712_005974 [Marasmius tenuissimus]|uniref:Alpha/beta hydrolase fold-3 domain-containing protein n=1 Tax=Marasmius tenuissimus TaxID=585030 RepID=A0ABR3A079_9AGAR